MKFLENERLAEITAELSEALLGNSHRIINGRIEAYTMKRAGNDKKFAHVLGKKYIQDLEEQQELLAQQAMMTPPTSQKTRKRSNSATSAMEMQPKKPRRSRSQSVDLTKLSSRKNDTAIGDFSEMATRRLMTDLILTLNASFPDYDFSGINPGQFEKLRLETARKSIYERLSEFSQDRKQFLGELWMAVNDVIDLRECDVYSFLPEEDIFDENLWSFSFFFVNKSLRRLVFFTCGERICDSDDEEEEKIAFYPEMDIEEESLDTNIVDNMDVSGESMMSIPVPISTT